VSDITVEGEAAPVATELGGAAGPFHGGESRSPGPRGGFFGSRFGGLPRQFWVLWAGQLVNRLGTFVEPFLALYLTTQRGLPLTTTGGILAVFGVGAMAAQPLGGWLGDRIGHRNAMIVGLVTTAATLLALGYARGVPVLIVTAFLFGVAVDLYRPAAQALIAQMVTGADRRRAYGLTFWAINLGFSVATVTAGTLAQHGFTVLFWADAATDVVFAVLLWRGVRGDRPQHSAQREEEGFRTVLRDRVMLAICGLVLLYASVYFQAYSTLPIDMSRSGLSPAMYGVVIALNGIVIILVQPVVNAWLARHEPSVVVAAGQMVVGAGFALTLLAGSAFAYGVTVVVWSLGEIAVASVGASLVADLAPAHLRGRYMGLWGLAWGTASALGPLVGTAVLAAAGRGVLWVGCGVAGLATAACQLALGPAIRRRKG
jgi:MFS family permease